MQEKNQTNIGENKKTKEFKMLFNELPNNEQSFIYQSLLNLSDTAYTPKTHPVVADPLN